MKKHLLFFVLLMTLVCFVSCGKGGEQIEINEEDIQFQHPAAGEEKPDPEAVSDIKQEQPSDKQEQVLTEQLPVIVAAKKGSYSGYVWNDDDAAMKAMNKTSYIVLNESEKAKYPSLANQLEQTASLCMSSADTELDNLVYLADMQLELYDGFNTQTSTLDMHIRRSDSIAFSVLSDSYMDTMYIEDLRAIHGTSYDTQSGKELAITDVVKDIPRFSEIVEDELFSHMWGGELTSDSAVKDYFDNRVPDGVSWGLDYNGVTVYFNRGDIADPVYGLAAVTVSFEKYPEVFYEKYLNTPDTYSVKLPLGCSNFFDIDNDGELEELVVSSLYDKEFRYHSDVYIVTSEDFYEENYFAYGFNPYYIKTKDNRHFLYLFGEGSEDWNRLMNLYVYEITGGKVRKMGEMPLAPHHSVGDDSADLFELPTDPCQMRFDLFSYRNGFSVPAFDADYEVSGKGVPIVCGQAETIPAPPEFNPESFVETELGIIDLFDTKWYGFRFVDGETGIPSDCNNDEELVMLEFFNTGNGLFTNGDIYSAFIWNVEDKKGIYLDMDGEHGYYGTVYRDSNARDWLMVQIDGKILWLYRGA